MTIEELIISILFVVSIIFCILPDMLKNTCSGFYEFMHNFGYFMLVIISVLVLYIIRINNHQLTDINVAINRNIP